MIVDIYTHIVPDRFFREMARVSPKLENIGARLRGVKKLFDLDLRFAEMDEIGDYRQVISLPNPPLEEIAQGEVAQQLSRVGLDASLMRRFPHQFSGGQRARIGIARALAVAPEFLVCDESVAALDVSIQAQVLNLFMDLKSALNLTYLFISHDLGVVEHISDRVVIMYLGRVVESGPTSDLYASPNHPYTQALLKEVGKVLPGKRTFVPIKGEIPSPLDPPRGCHFHPRCPFAMDKCRETAPPLREIAPGHRSACYLNDSKPA